METTYYSVNARRVTVCDQASGENPRSYTCLSPRPRSGQRAGTVLDLEAYRRRLSGDAGAEHDVGGAFAEADAPAEAPTARTTPGRAARRMAPVVLEVCVSLSLIAMAWVVVTQFLRFL